MPVNTQRAEYQSMSSSWQKGRDCYQGSDAVKARGRTYLPPIDSHKNDAEKYMEYVLRASFFNAMGRTVDGMAGAVFQKEPTVKLPGSIEDHKQDITLSGVPLELFGLRATRELLITGRYGILVEVGEEPKVAPPPPGTVLPEPGAKTTLQRPYWCGWAAESIYSWRVEYINGASVLTRVVLQEQREEQDPRDPFAYKNVEQFRVLELVGGIYTQALYEKKPNTDTWVQVGGYTPTKRGTPLPFIPFLFVGPTTCSPEVEKPPLRDLVDVLLALYRNSADYEHGLHYTGIPIPWIAGAQVKQGEKLSFGPSKAIQVDKGGQVGIIQADGNLLGALKEAMAEKRKLCATLGARLLEEQPATAEETATAVRMRHSGDHATLRTIAQSIEQSLTKAARIHAWWAGLAETPEDSDASVELNKDFFSTRLGAQELSALVAALQAEAISFDTFYYLLERGEHTRPGVTAKQEKALIDKAAEEAAALLPDPMLEGEELPEEDDGNGKPGAVPPKGGAAKPGKGGPPKAAPQKGK